MKGTSEIFHQALSEDETLQIDALTALFSKSGKEAFLKKIHEHELDAPSGHVYCYKTGLFIGDVSFKEDFNQKDFDKTEWVILKVGISKPGSLSDRLNEEARRYKRIFPCL